VNLTAVRGKGVTRGGAEESGELHTHNHQHTEAGLTTMPASGCVGLLRGPSPRLRGSA
jgi:hypothetical protein